MRKIRSISYTIIFLFLFTILKPVFAFDKTNGTAFTMKEGDWQIGLFAPLKLSFSDSVDWTVHPLAFFVLPNLEAKIAHPNISEFAWVSEHGFYTPTFLLRQLSREGTGGFISPEFNIPQMAAIYNGVVFSKKLTEKHILSFKAGFTFAVKTGKLDKRTTIDLPFVYPRLAVFYSGYQITTEINTIGKLFKKLSYQVSVTGFWSDESAIESNGSICWNSSGKTRIQLGYLFSYAQFPFGSQAHLLFPVLDVVWHFHK